MGDGSQNSMPAQLKHAPRSRDTESRGRETPSLPLLYFVDTIYANKQIFLLQLYLLIHDFLYVLVRC